MSLTRLIVDVQYSRQTTSLVFFFFSSRRRHTRFDCDWSSDVCSSDLTPLIAAGFQATIPRSANPENRPEGEGEVKLGIDKDGKFWLDLGSGPKQIPDDQLPERLQTVYETHTQDKILFLKADQNIEFGRVQQAIEIARQAGVRVVGAITEQKQQLAKKKGEG